MPTAVPAESTVDRDRQEQALSNPTIEKGGSDLDKAGVWKETLEKDYSHLSAEQQGRYADLQRNIVPAAPSKDQEMEM